MSTGQRKAQPTQRPNRSNGNANNTLQVITERPISSVLFAFGIGFGVGAVLGKMLGDSAAPQSSYDRYYSQGKRYFNQAESQAERFGKQMMDAISGMIPDAVSQYLPK